MSDDRFEMLANGSQWSINSQELAEIIGEARRARALESAYRMALESIRDKIGAGPFAGELAREVLEDPLSILRDPRQGVL